MTEKILAERLRTLREKPNELLAAKASLWGLHSELQRIHRLSTEAEVVEGLLLLLDRIDKMLASRS